MLASSGAPPGLAKSRPDIVDTDDDWHELVDPLLARAVPLQLRVLDAEPEFDDCRRLASQAGVPVRTVLAEASAAASRLLPSRKRN